MGSNHQEEWEKLERAREKFIHELSQNMHLYGISETVGRLYGTVLFSNKPMNLDEMSESLGMSKTSMSTGIRTLLKANMVERVWEKGNRKDLYKTVDDWYKSFSTVFINRWRSSVDNNLKALEEMKRSLAELENSSDETIKELIQEDMEKLRYAKQYYEWLKKVVRLFETGEIYDIVPK